MLVQESRFQMMDDEGASHLFLLSPHAAVEPAQLGPLAARQARIRVEYAAGENIVGAVVKSIEVEPFAADSKT